ncbi:hypothetical protein MUK70_01315 [Dyadobacter chenwenxiniae]|uniref:Uncharacterized protein n=1 Tax=Dyadobacter chenwenxiniae TaxID=2906456 RepID=A0A9X1PJQ6_9BACT|nr:hypothetical protein [Dyadobacter chenwenxiniae]MCF0062612.1 hypothetical protein [Dyadobacter chenwenxiniae]UON83642.1 hypothetical protein MUK70_01315 [Dyadobacter chenwenxiniae]
MHHTFHIPVLGLGYSIDTPVKVSHFGISSVMSIVDDEMIERMRKHHSIASGEIFVPINKNEDDFRARRITAYLNLVNRIADKNFEDLKNQSFEDGADLNLYFQLLPEHSTLKKQYLQMMTMEASDEKQLLQATLKSQLTKGAIDVNIMSKVDKLNKDVYGQNLPDAFSDASAALRGFANSTLSSSLVLSAGMNPRLYNYLENFADFYPIQNGHSKKQIILKVSDFRSAFIQAKYLAKKGIWISEFRIESGLNCGGHAFATDGFLLGPILEEFKLKKQEMLTELFALYEVALNAKSIDIKDIPALRITVQGGIGTAQEDEFLLKHYEVDATGWGSPFLLVPEVTNVDDQTLSELTKAESSDYYVSNSSPLGVLFNNFKRSSAEKQRLERIAKGRPGSPCKKKYLVSNTEFTAEPICTASRQYQNLKIKQIQSLGLSTAEREVKISAVTEKLCLCEGLSTATLIKHKLLTPRENHAVSICPGPNLAWFSKIYKLSEMVDHIYGRADLLAGVSRPNMFINELALYVAHYQTDVGFNAMRIDDKKQKYLEKFRTQLLAGIDYYKALIPEFVHERHSYREAMLCQLEVCEQQLQETMDNDIVYQQSRRDEILVEK